MSLQTTILTLMKMAESFPKGQKTLWEKGKLFVTNNFSFSYSVFKRLIQQTRKNQVLFGKGLISFLYYWHGSFLSHFSNSALSHTIPFFLNTSGKRPFENTVEKKGQTACNQYFLPFPPCFLPYQRKTASFEPH